jgi:hypothetical protein
VHAITGLSQDRQGIDVLGIDFAASGQFFELFSHKIKYLADS